MFGIMQIPDNYYHRRQSSFKGDATYTPPIPPKFKKILTVKIKLC